MAWFEYLRCRPGFLRVGLGEFQLASLPSVSPSQTGQTPASAETASRTPANNKSFDRILFRTSIIRLSNLATPELMVAVSRFVLQKIYATMLSKGPSGQLRLFAVVDEAHKLSYDETLTELIREARKYGVGILLASQSVKDFDRIVFDMVGTKIALQLEGGDAKVMAENLGLTDKNERDMARAMILHQPPLCLPKTSYARFA